MTYIPARGYRFPEGRRSLEPKLTKEAILSKAQNMEKEIIKDAKKRIYATTGLNQVLWDEFHEAGTEFAYLKGRGPFALDLSHDVYRLRRIGLVRDKKLWSFSSSEFKFQNPELKFHPFDWNPKKETVKDLVYGGEEYSIFGSHPATEAVFDALQKNLFRGYIPFGDLPENFVSLEVKGTPMGEVVYVPTWYIPFELTMDYKYDGDPTFEVGEEKWHGTRWNLIDVYLHFDLKGGLTLDAINGGEIIFYTDKPKEPRKTHEVVQKNYFKGKSTRDVTLNS